MLNKFCLCTLPPPSTHTHVHTYTTQQFRRSRESRVSTSTSHDSTREGSKNVRKTLLVLPPKTESVKLIEWPDAKTKNLYLEEEKKAKEMFLNIAKKHLVNRNTIRLFGALLPVRLFCSLGCAGESSSSSSADSYFCDGCYGRYLSKQMDKLTCGHIFCQKRCMELVEADKKCLKCDAVLQADEIVPYNMDLAKSSSASSSSSLSKSINSKITGVKIKLLIKELAELRQKDKTAKVLIFSQFVKTLDQAKIELEKAGLKYRTS